jgi:hypothetical protein
MSSFRSVGLVLSIPTGCHTVSVSVTHTNLTGDANLYCIGPNPDVAVGLLKEI